jgi:hypothetical protein
VLAAAGVFLWRRRNARTAPEAAPAAATETATETATGETTAEAPEAD